MDFCLFGANTLSEPMLLYCNLDPWEHISVKFESKYNIIYTQKYILEYHLQNGGHFVSASLWL